MTRVYILFNITYNIYIYIYLLSYSAGDGTENPNYLRLYICAYYVTLYWRGSYFLCLLVMEWMYALVQVQGHISDCSTIWRQILGSCSLHTSKLLSVMFPHPYLEPNALWKSLPNTEQRKIFLFFIWVIVFTCTVTFSPPTKNSIPINPWKSRRFPNL